MPDDRSAAQIYVLAGPNGAGKSSVLGSGLTERNLDFFNPDQVAERARRARPRWSVEQANSFAWREGQRLLDNAIANGLRFAFETTLGGTTVTRRLEECLIAGGEVRMWFVCLDTPARHIERVRRRAAAGGHDIPDELIRRRYDASRRNLIRLIPRLTELIVFDNSADGEPDQGLQPLPVRVLRTANRKLLELCEPSAVPEWAKPVVMAALTASGER